MPEKFRANESERGGFWFWKKSPLQNKHRRNIYVPAKDIISQANDVVNKCISGKSAEQDEKAVIRAKRVQTVFFLGASATVLSILVYFLIH